MGCNMQGAGCGIGFGVLKFRVLGLVFGGLVLRLDFEV